VLALATARAIGRDPDDVLPLAAAIELIHTYSLIHDDLPAMDDDDLRRGRPTCHVKFGEDVAILAGDGLYAEAFRHLLGEQAGEPALVLAAARELAAPPASTGWSAGSTSTWRGGGHARGAAPPARPEDRAPDRRVGGLRPAPGRHGRDRDGTLAALRRRARRALPDRRRHPRRDRTDAALGKPSGSDERMGKRTYVSHFGVDGARDLARQCHESARASLREAAPAGATELEQITDFILTRTA
jgi:geranylgeranyl diphosphate synthase type II